MTIKRRRRRKVVTMRRPVSRAERRRWNAAADKLLERTEEMFELSGDFDTAVRDSVSTGLAYIVNAAYDCRACGMDFSNTEEWLTFIESATGEWFRKHGFVEWYCGAAASLFRTTPPRHLANSFEWGTYKGKKVMKFKAGAK